MIDISTLGEGSLAVRFETSTATSTIQDVEATVVPLPMNVKRRKMPTAKEGSVGFKNTAGVWSRHILVATQFITCIKMSEICTISATTCGST